MLKVSDIMTPDVASVSPETTLKDAVELFAAMHVSGAPVASGTRVLGVISAADILDFAASTPGVPTERPGQTEWGDWSEPAAEEEPENENVVPGSYFTELWSDAGADAVDRMATLETSEWNVLEEHTVDEVMTRTVCTLAPNHTVLEAADLMKRKAIHRVLVVQDGRLVGIVSALDIARAVADHKLAERRYVFNRDRDFDEPPFSD